MWSLRFGLAHYWRRAEVCVSVGKPNSFKVNVDTLTMTATRFRVPCSSADGARDLSNINTPPPNRYPVQTEVHRFNEDIIREAINPWNELERSGLFHKQPYPEHLRDRSPDTPRSAWCPYLCGTRTDGARKAGKDYSRFRKLRIRCAYRNQHCRKWHRCIQCQHDSDKQCPAVRIIGSASVARTWGRSNRKAFCYLLSPPQFAYQEARRRLQAIENFSELEGIHIAMQDLDIRGAGNMLVPNRAAS